MEIYIIATLIIGLIAGFLGQRSRMCFVGGIRDLYLIKSTYLFKGLIGFFSFTFLVRICAYLVLATVLNRKFKQFFLAVFAPGTI